MKFWIKQGDRSPSLVATLTDDAGQPVPTDSFLSVRLLMRDRSDNSLIVDSAASFLNPRTDGKVQYNWGANDTLTPGTFDAEFEVTKSAGVTQTYPGDEMIEVEVSPSVDGAVNAGVPAALIYNLRRATGELGETDYGDTELAEVISARGADMDAAAYDVWTWKASNYANLVNVKEGGSDRSLGDLLDNALKMVAFYGSRSALIVDETNIIIDTRRRSRTRAIVRE